MVFISQVKMKLFILEGRKIYHIDPSLLIHKPCTIRYNMLASFFYIGSVLIEKCL